MRCSPLTYMTTRPRLTYTSNFVRGAMSCWSSRIGPVSLPEPSCVRNHDGGPMFAFVNCAGETFTTLELKTNYLRAVTEGRLTATGRVIHQGRTVGLTDCEVVDEQGRRIAHATSTCMTLHGR